MAWFVVVAAVIAAPALPDAPAGADRAAAGDRTLTVLQKSGPATLLTDAVLQDGRLVINFTDQLFLRVEVAGAGRPSVKPPERWIDEPWHVGKVEPPEVEKSSGGQRWVQRFWLEPLAPGEPALQLASIQYREGKGPWRNIDWQPVPVLVRAKLKQPDVDSARDITSIEHLPGAATGTSTLWLAAGALAAALIMVVLWRSLRGRRLASPRSPEATALAELDRLTALGLAQRGRGERLGTLLAGLVRRYLERKFHAPARRQTTSELLASLPPQLDSQRAWLEDFLRRCDQIKFAPIDVRADECARLVAQVREHLSSAMPT